MKTRIALVGDELPGHPSHRALTALRKQLEDRAELSWVPTDGPVITDLGAFDGVWLVPGSPYASDAAVYSAIRRAREEDVPFLGTCGGMQYAVIELFRNLLGVTDASHQESDGESSSNVVTALACSLQGEAREVTPVPGTRFAKLVGDAPFTGMHHCGYAPAPKQLERLFSSGVEVQATAKDAGAEVIELTSRQFFMASLFQPHLGALTGQPVHPLISEFLRCAAARTRASR